MSEHSNLLSAFQAYAHRTDHIKSALLFGSSASTDTSLYADSWSDFDVHLVTSDVRKSEQIRWGLELPDQGFRFQVVRPATGGVRKVTAFFAVGQIDLVVVPRYKLTVAKLAFGLGLYPRVRALRVGLDEIHTCIRSGYRFLKGETDWGGFYSSVERHVRGVRLDDPEAIQRVTLAAAELVWILQKVRRGELSAAQRQLHYALADTNFLLLREVWLRNGKHLQSFGLARRVESMATREEVDWVKIDARLDRREIEGAAWRSFEGCQALLQRLIPGSRLPDEVMSLVSSYRDDSVMT
jgi:hypothetical protein